MFISGRKSLPSYLLPIVKINFNPDLTANIIAIPPFYFLNAISTNKQSIATCTNFPVMLLVTS